MSGHLEASAVQVSAINSTSDTTAGNPLPSKEADATVVGQMITAAAANAVTANEVCMLYVLPGIAVTLLAGRTPYA